MKSKTLLHRSSFDLIYGINPIEYLINCKPDRIITIFLIMKKPINNSNHHHHQATLKVTMNSRIKNIYDLANKQQIAVQAIKATTIAKWFPEKINHQGIIAKITPTKLLVEEDLLGLIEQYKLTKALPIFLILDNIQDPRNLGACIRNAAAFGITGVIISRNATCDLTATVKKVASGAVEMVPIIKVGNLASCINRLKEYGIWIISLGATHTNKLSALDLKIPLAVVLGSEEHGVRNIIEKNSDFLAKIPMIANGIDSLNLSVAAGISLYEVNRQRNW